MKTRIKHHGPITEFQWKSTHWATIVPKWTSSYLVDKLLIDTGAPAGKEQILQWISSLPEDEKPKRIILTHFHEDHSGGAHLLQNELGLPIFCSHLTQLEFNDLKPYRWFRQIYWGKKLTPPNSVNTIPINNTVTSESGKYYFQLISIPGHSPDLTALLDSKNQLLFVGDGIMKRYEMLFGGGCVDLQENIQEIYESQKKLYELTEGMDNLQIFVAHSKVYPRDFLKEKIDEIENLHTKAHSLKSELEKKGITKENTLINKIIKQIWLKGENSLAKFLSHGEISFANLVKSLLQWPIN